MTHQTSASRKEAKNKAVVKKEGGVRAQVRLEPRGKSETTVAAVTHASRASGKQALTLLWSRPSRPRRGKTIQGGRVRPDLGLCSSVISVLLQFTLWIPGWVPGDLGGWPSKDVCVLGSRLPRDPACPCRLGEIFLSLTSCSVCSRKTEKLPGGRGITRS